MSCALIKITATTNSLLLLFLLLLLLLLIYIVIGIIDIAQLLVVRSALHAQHEI
jgi:cell division protein FtsB